MLTQTHTERHEPDPQRRAVSIILASDLAGVSRRTIYNWIATGKVEWFRTASGRIRIYADTLFRDSASKPTPKASYLRVGNI